MPKMLGEKKGNGQFAMLQEKMIEKREEYLNLNRMVCWEWALEDQSGAKRTKSRSLVETIKEMLSPLNSCFHWL